MKKIVLIALLFSGCIAVNAQQNTLNLMPVPKSIATTAGVDRINSKFTVSVKADASDTILYQAVNRAYQTLNRKTGLVFPQQYITIADKDDSASLIITVKERTSGAIGVNESYSVDISAKQIALDAQTTDGALHGLQTVIQLLSKDESGFYFPCVAIDDSPRFKWRGLMLDVARHFVSYDEIKRNIDAMAAVKMNVLHWHLTDDEGFRVESKVFPLLHQKGSDGDYYTQAQLKDILKYAAERGIVIVPEFDMPGHTQSWFAGYPELASQPGPYHPGPRMQWQKEHPEVKTPPIKSITDIVANMVAPTFDPTNEKVYAFLDKFIGEMATIFPAEYMHIGADENNGMAWKLNSKIMDWMKQHQMQSTDDLQRYFVQRVHDIMKKHHRRMIGWEEIYNDKLPKDAIVQKWIPSDNSMIKSYGMANDIARHNTVLISEGFYLDLFLPAYIHYTNASIAAADHPNIWGGEAAQWTELVDNNNVDGRIWPRAAAIAERLWSPASVTDVDDMYRRLYVLSHELDEQGLNHISNYERALRRLTKGQPTTHLEVLTDVLTQVKGYKKLIAGMMKAPQASFQTTPLTSVSDIVLTDPEMKRKFRALVKLYLEKHDKNAEDAIRACLQTWKENDAYLEPLFVGNKRLAEVQDHSKNLAAAAAIGLEALDKIDKGGADADWMKKQSDTLGAFEKSHYETELAVIPEIEELVMGHTIPEPEKYSAF
jgi:hexosaminidase